MTEEERLAKNNKIREKGKETRARRHVKMPIDFSEKKV